MGTIDYKIIPPKVIAKISSVNFELEILSDHCTMTVTLILEQLKSKFRNISLNLYNRAD